MKGFDSLRTKIIVSYIMLAIVPILIISYFSFVTYSKGTDDTVNKLLDYAGKQASENVTDKMAYYNDIVARIITDSRIMNAIKRFDSVLPFSSDAALLRNQITDYFSSYAEMDNYITSIALITASYNSVAYDRRDSSSYFASKWYDENFCKGFVESTNASYKINVLSAVNFPGAPASVAQRLYFTFPAADLINKNNYGVLVLEVDSDAFNSIISAHNSNSGLDAYISPSSCLTNNIGEIIVSPNYQIIGKNMSFDTDLGFANNAYESFQVGDTPFSLNLFFERNTLQQYINNFRNLVIILTITITICCIVIVFIVTQNLWIKVKKIAVAIKEFRQNQQDIDVNIDKNEGMFYTIAEQFNKMSTEISSLITELKNKNEHIVLISDQRRKAEIRAIQAQINPHFLYNALDRINWIAIDNDQNEISVMLNNLAGLLRYSISNIDMLVPLRDEINWMEKYISIQSERFDKKIDFICSVNGDAIDFPIYKMLLQPIVENSILHGFVDKQKDACINLSAVILEDGSCKIVLSDNGKGIEPDTLKLINEMIEQKDIIQTDSVGISNVINRLRLYYEDKASISVESIKGNGTEFTLIIPYRGQI